jgi:non-homologous end joining protein Ku
MKATAKVSISMGLLTIPNVKMFTAVDSGEKVSFSQLHYDCKQTREQKMYCPAVTG